jgi:two-component system OmpR family response regulator
VRPPQHADSAPIAKPPASPEDALLSDILSAKPCVLVVEDNNEVRALLDLSLQHHGFAVLLASTGQEGIELYQRSREKVSIVLLDVQMPGLDGPQTLAALRSITPDLRCCFMSGHTGKYTVEELMRQGATHVFQKPFRLQELADVLHWVLRDALTSSKVTSLATAAPSEERRKSSRIAGKPVGVLLATDEAAGQTVHGVVVNHSADGLCVLVEHAAEPGTVLYVRPGEPSALVVWAPIEIRHQRAYDHRWGLGCRFVATPPPDILRLYD